MKVSLIMNAFGKLSLALAAGVISASTIFAPQSVDAGNVRVPVTAIGHYFANDSKDYAARFGFGTNYSAALSESCLETTFSGQPNYSGSELCENRNYFVFDLSAFDGLSILPGSAISLELPGAYSSQTGTFELRHLASGDFNELGVFGDLGILQDTDKVLFDGIGNGTIIGTSSDPGLLRSNFCSGLSGDDLLACQIFPPYTPFSVGFNALGETVLNDAFGGYLVLGGTMTGPPNASRFTASGDYMQYAGTDPNFPQPAPFFDDPNFLFLTFTIPTPGSVAVIGIGIAALCGLRARQKKS